MADSPKTLKEILAQGHNYKLSRRDELAYQVWRKENNVPESNDYNMRGYYQSLQLPGAQGSSVNANDGQMHYPDTFKLPNHQTFSTESGYYNPATMPNTPSWSGGPVPGLPGKESWSLISPDGTVVHQEGPTASQIQQQLLNQQTTTPFAPM